MVELILSCLITLKIVPVWEARGGVGFKDERLFSPQKYNSRNLRRINVKKRGVSACFFSIACSSNLDTLRARDLSESASVCGTNPLHILSLSQK